jgi:hypothetical protein|tara:strand:- start:1783 stop:2103 length:321 start_codon:yes stop_codon:yes gene_type:complete
VKAIDKAKAHFNTLEIKKIDVPEWDLVIYAKPLNLFETKKLMRFANDDSVEMLAYVVMLKSLDEKGDPLFTLEDKHALLNDVDKDVLARVANDIMNQQPQDVIKKN